MNKPIRVLQVVTNMNAGGIENMLMNLYRNIDRSKIQFDFLIHTDEKCFFEDEIKSLGGKIHTVQSLKLNNLIQYHKELNQFFKLNSYPIVHVHRSIWSYFVLKAAKKNNIPIRIAHSHEAHESIWTHRLIRIPLILILKHYINAPLTHRAACGTDAGEWLFGENKDFVIINNSIKTEDFIYNENTRKRMRKEFKLKDELVIGNISRFNTQKNHTFLLDIFKSVKQLKSNAKLVLVGDGNLKEQIIKKAKDLNIYEDIIFTGVRKDIPNILQMLDVIVMPSLFEGLPVTLIEAQAAGLKIFASDTITKETQLSDEVEFISLNTSPNQWAVQIINSVPYLRKNNLNLIKEKNYDIVSNAKWLESFYIKKLELKDER